MLKHAKDAETLLNSYLEEGTIYNVIDGEHRINQIFSRWQGICEIYGQSGAGKSTLLFQHALAVLRDDRECKVLFLSCDGPFCVQRLKRLLEVSQCPQEVRMEDLLNRVLVQPLTDLEAQEHYLSFFLEPIVLRNKVRCIYVDSISANFRGEPRTKELTASLHHMAYRLSSISAHHGVKVLVSNQITDNLGILTEQRQPSFIPALGLSWTNCISTRIKLVKSHDRERILELIFCPFAKSFSVLTTLSSRGFSANP
jgi:hypothetical protein